MENVYSLSFLIAILVSPSIGIPRDDFSDCKVLLEGRCLDLIDIDDCRGDLVPNRRRLYYCPRGEICCIDEDHTTRVTTRPTTTVRPVTITVKPITTAKTVKPNTKPTVATTITTTTTVPTSTTTIPTTTTTIPTSTTTIPTTTTTVPTSTTTIPTTTTTIPTSTTTIPTTTTTSKPTKPTKPTNPIQTSITTPIPTSGTTVDPLECGKGPIISQPTAVPMLIGGSATTRGTWPWMVSVMSSYGTNHQCGGVIITDRWILTSARCFYMSSDTNYYKVRVGEHDFKVSEGSEVDLEVEQIVKHPEYDATTYRNDIALVKLRSAVDLTSRYAGLVCLPKSSMSQRDFVGETAWTTGWGITKTPADSQVVLRQVGSFVISNSDCVAQLGSNVQPTNICFGTSTTTTCQGDGGGPLVYQENGVWHVIGVASWSIDTCDKPATFSRVTAYMDFIVSNIMEKAL